MVLGASLGGVRGGVELANGRRVVQTRGRGGRAGGGDELAAGRAGVLARVAFRNTPEDAGEERGGRGDLAVASGRCRGAARVTTNRGGLAPRLYREGLFQSEEGDVQGVGERTGDARGRRHRATTRRRRGCPLPHARIQRKSLRERRNERRRTYRPVEVNSLGGSGTQEVGRATAVGRERRPRCGESIASAILLGGVRSEAAASARRVLVKIEPRGRAGADVWVSDPRSRPNHKAASCVTLTRKVHSAERVAPHARSRPRARDGHHGAHRAREFQRPSPLPRGLLLSDPLTRASPPARLPSVIFFCRSFDGARVVAALSARRELRLTVQFPRSSSLSQSTIASSAEFELANMVRDRSSRPGSAPPRLHRTIY